MFDGYVCIYVGKVLYNYIGDVVSDQFYKFLDDIDLMMQLNVDVYWFFIFWFWIMKFGEFNYYKLGSF